MAGQRLKQLFADMPADSLRPTPICKQQDKIVTYDLRYVTYDLRYVTYDLRYATDLRQATGVAYGDVYRPAGTSGTC